jgi:hypothetical protein
MRGDTMGLDHSLVKIRRKRPSSRDRDRDLTAEPSHLLDTDFIRDNAECDSPW